MNEQYNFSSTSKDLKIEARKQDVFPQTFYEFYFPQNIMTPLCNEVIKNKDKIKKINDIHYADGTAIAVDYWTDFQESVKLNEMEKIIHHVGRYFKDMRVNCDRYWTAIYGKYGVHDSHIHSKPLFGSNICNLSSILYLTNIGSTKFHNPSTHNVMDTEVVIFSHIGKMIMFPSNILHSSPPHNVEKEKIIISANWQIFK